jgi:hypothetical protein
MSSYGRAAIAIRKSQNYSQRQRREREGIDLGIARYLMSKSQGAGFIISTREDFLSIIVEGPMPRMSELNDIFSDAQKAGCKVLAQRGYFSIESARPPVSISAVQIELPLVKKKTMLSYSLSGLSPGREGVAFAGMLDRVASKLGMPRLE